MSLSNMEQLEAELFTIEEAYDHLEDMTDAVHSEQIIKILDLLVTWDADNPEHEVGMSVSRWAIAKNISLFSIFKAALEDRGMYTLIPLLLETWEKWEIESEAKWKQWEVDIEAAHDRFLDQQERDEF